MAATKSRAKKVEAWPFPTPGITPRRPTKRNAALKSTQRTAARTAKAATKVHTVKATISNFELTKATSSITLNVFANKSKLGEIEVGSGSIYWTGHGKQKSKRINWTKFAEMMNKLAYGE